MIDRSGKYRPMDCSLYDSMELSRVYRWRVRLGSVRMAGPEDVPLLGLRIRTGRSRARGISSSGAWGGKCVPCGWITAWVREDAPLPQ